MLHLHFGGRKHHYLADTHVLDCFFCVVLLLMKQTITKGLNAYKAGWIICTLCTTALIFGLLRV